MFFFDQGPQSFLSSGSRAALVKIVTSVTPNHLTTVNFVVFVCKCGRRHHNRTWRTTGSI